MAQLSEFRVDNVPRYDQRSPQRWILSHVLRYKWFLAGTLLFFLLGWAVYSGARLLIGEAAAVILNPTEGPALLWIALAILGLLMLDGLSMLFGSFAAENIAAGIEADARQELYVNLLGKSKEFHDRQRVGDIMARATEDTQQLARMIAPGGTLIYEVILGVLVPIVFIAMIDPMLTLVPIVFVGVYLVLVRRYLRRLEPIIRDQRDAYGKLNAGLEESISGIEVVKASATEHFERRKYRQQARKFRDLFVAQGYQEARYLPLLAYGLMVGATFLHAMLLFRSGQIDLAGVIGTMGLVGLLQFPVFISIFAFSLLQLGLAGAGRILQIIRTETDLDENRAGHNAQIAGEIVFEQVGFGYAPDNDGRPARPVLQDISFRVAPGQTVAIVGQTGAGKSALTQLVNRTYDATSGQVLIDGVDVRDWSLDALRSQISKIEQDVFLFSRSIAENIAFGAPGAGREQIEAAARSAQAHDFISGFAEGYETVIGERGVTLSGGQRQRIALARAFLNDPRILILDDSTSAVDSATEDQIQRAIRQARAGRTLILITNRLSQIRWADLILVLDRGRVVAQGSHEDLLRRSLHYRRIFARYDVELPPLEEASERQMAAD
jgi:ATP-binding cassette subfamily B protein